MGKFYIYSSRVSLFAFLCGFKYKFVTRIYIYFRVVKTASALLGLAFLFSSQASLALGVGSAQANSYIGQRLSVRIPLFNVASPDSLQVSFGSTQFGGNKQAKVTVQLDRSSPQLAIQLSSEAIVNEPYLNFALTLVDSGTELVKEFNVLLDLAPSRAESSESKLSAGSLEQKPFTVDSSSAGINTMGPYETAIKGQVPSRFGAVLDGQSLWRVARRINVAMGVTRSQMMWALYQANPQAFTAPHIESLKAGVYLTIPSVEVVNQLTDSQAKIELQSLSKAQHPNVAAAQIKKHDSPMPASLNVEVGTVERGLVDNVVLDDAVQNTFQVTPIDQAVDNEGNEDREQQSQEIISSLTETVGNMSQQLERKDKKIEFLERQVEELKVFMQNEVMNEPHVNSLVPNATLERANNELKAPSQRLAPPSRFKEIGSWLLVVALFFSVVAFVFRRRLSDLLKALNLFGKRKDMQFSIAGDDIGEASLSRHADGLPYESSTLTTDHSFDLDGSSEHGSISVHSVNVDEGAPIFEPNAQVSAGPIFEEARLESAPASTFMGDDDGAQEEAMATVQDVHLVFSDSSQAAFEGSYDESDIDEAIDFLSDEILTSDEESGLGFDKRFELLLQEKDYDFALELLNFARYNEINDERYHFERLRMLVKIGNEDGFYKYYYSIEDDISGLSHDFQTKISQLVVKMAHI